MRDVTIIGGGQSGLAVAYFLKRAGLDFVMLDSGRSPGGAWSRTWDSLTLFSPAAYSSLPGWPFPPKGNGYPTRNEVVAYLTAYEQRYALPVERPVQVHGVMRSDGGLICETDRGRYESRVVVSCTGTWGNPFIPDVPGREVFKGQQIHSADYRRPDEFAGKTVAIVGGGNSGAQILAEVSKVSKTLWITEREPKYLPDDVDGRVLLQVSTMRYEAKKAGRPDEVPPSLGDIVMVETVKEARSRGVLQSFRPFVGFSDSGVVWADGTNSPLDAVVWCTGFRPSLGHLAPLKLPVVNGRPNVANTRSVDEPRLWLVGYGEWTGFGSATLTGVQRYAKATAAEIASYLHS